MITELLNLLLITNAFSAVAYNYEGGKSLTTKKEDLSGPVNIELAARADYQREYCQPESIKDNSEIKGKHLILNLNGNITERFSYSYCQRLNELHYKNSIFDSTDAMWLKNLFNNQ